MAQYQSYTKPANARLVRLYQAGLKNIEAKLATLYKTNIPPKGDVLTILREELKTLIAQRQVIIRDNLTRSAAKAYNDTLYRASRLVGIEVKLNAFNDADAAALIRKRPRKVPSFKKLVAKHAKDSRKITPLRVERLLPKELDDLGQVRTAIKQGLLVDANINIRFTNAEMTRIVNNAVNLSFETITNPGSTINQLIASTGMEFVKVWKHDSPKVPREYHRDVLHNSLPDADGYWHQDGDKADGPGGFSDPANNMNCRCSIEIMTVKDYLDQYGRSYLQSWSYLPE